MKASAKRYSDDELLRWAIAHAIDDRTSFILAVEEGASADTMRFTFFHGWLMQVVSEMARTLKEGGVICLNTGKTRDWQGSLMPMDVMLYEDLRRAGLTFQSRVVWTSSHGLTPKQRLAERYETILIFSKGTPTVFNPTPARIPQKQPGKRAFKGPNKGQLSGNPFGGFPTDVWGDIPTVRHNHPERAHGAHPAQFPVDLAKRAIMLFTKPGDLVCDPFSGSGSTAVAAIETARDFVGADLFYEDLRSKRIAAAVPDYMRKPSSTRFPATLKRKATSPFCFNLTPYRLAT